MLLVLPSSARPLLKVKNYCWRYLLSTALVFAYDFHAGAETMFSRHFNDPSADSYFTKRKWGKSKSHFKSGEWKMY